MTFRQTIGGVIAIPSMLAMPLIWISGVILHFFTAFVAYGLAGPGWWGYVAFGGVLMLPIIGEIAVFIGAWSTTGNLLNGYSEWLLSWLIVAALLFGLVALGAWIGGAWKDRAEDS